MHPPLPRSALIWILLAGTAALAGCSSIGGYPSLAPRPVEQGPATEAAPAVSQLPVDEALDTEVAALAAQAAQGHAEFTRVADGSCTVIARGGNAAPGSEPWIAGQQALSALEAARSPLLAAAASLDRLVIERGTATGTAIDLTKLAEAQAQVSGLETVEQARMAELTAGHCTR